jgi:hypothetical protein
MLALVRRDLCRSLFRANEACFWHGAWRHQHSPGGKWFGVWWCRRACAWMMYGVFVGGQTPSLHVRLPRSSVTSTLVCDCKCSLEGIAFGCLNLTSFDLCCITSIKLISLPCKNYIAIAQTRRSRSKVPEQNGEYHFEHSITTNAS